MLNLHKLEIFAAVVRTGSFSGAAEQLLMTQPAVSQHIHDLERSVGTRLFTRGRRGVALTPSGEKLYAYTRTIFQLVAEAEAAVTDVEHLAAGQITVGATPGVSGYLLPDWLQDFRGRYPNLAVAVQTGITTQIIADLRNGRVDLGLIEGEWVEAQESAIDVQPLEVVDQMVIVGPKHPWWGRQQVQVAELDGQTFVMRQRNSQTRIWLETALQQHAIRPKIGAEFDTVESIKRAVAIGTGLTILPEYAVRPEVEMGKLAMLSIAGQPLRRTLKLVWNREAYLSPVARTFLDFIRRYLPALETDRLVQRK